MENIRIRLAALLFLFLFIFHQIAHTQSENVSTMTQKSNIPTTTEIYGNTIKKISTADNFNTLREKRQLGYYPYEYAHTQSENVSTMTQKSNIPTTTEIYGNTIKKISTADNFNTLREKRQLGYYPYEYGFYRPRPIPIIISGIGIGAPIFGRPGFGGRGFGFGSPAFGGRGFGFGRPGFGGRGFGGFSGRGFGGFGGRGFGGGRGGRG